MSVKCQQQPLRCFYIDLWLADFFTLETAFVTFLRQASQVATLQAIACGNPER